MYRALSRAGRSRAAQMQIRTIRRNLPTRVRTGATEKRQKSGAKEDTKQLGRKGKAQTVVGNVNESVYYRTQDGGSFKIKTEGCMTQKSPYWCMPKSLSSKGGALQRRWQEDGRGPLSFLSLPVASKSAPLPTWLDLLARMPAQLV